MAVVNIVTSSSSLQKRGEKHYLLYLLLLLILQAADIELNPGPYQPKYPCQICDKAVRELPRSPNLMRETSTGQSSGVLQCDKQPAATHEVNHLPDASGMICHPTL